jgi:LmbE family N-acetylglucosaminyl deacetylase
MSTHKLTALAVCAHPDDIEFHMAGTLLLLKEAGAGKAIEYAGKFEESRLIL